MLSFLHRNVVYPAVLAVRGELEMYDVLDRFEALQWEDRATIHSRQARKLGEVLSHAARTVPYYRERWDIDVPVSASRAFDVLQQLPILTKEELQNSTQELQSEDCSDRKSTKTTGGSTGQPVTVLKDRAALARERAASWLGYGWFGVQIGDKGARFWGSPRDLGFRWLRFLLADLTMNRIRFSAFAFEKENLEEYWHRCLKWGPDYLYGYVSMLTEFARHLQEQGHDGSRLDLKAVVATAEALSPPQRDMLSSVFSAPVQNEYGCGEVGAIAYECRENSLHIMLGNVHVELLREDGSHAGVGESGEVVVTDLNNRAMPLIRYRVGDRAVQGEGCSCGRNFPVIDKIEGRAYDFVQDTAGRRYHGEYFMYLFEDLRDRGAQIDQFRVTQESERKLVIEIAGPARLDGDEEQFIRSRLHRDMARMHVSIVELEEIPRLPSGKTRIIRNRCLTTDRPS